MGANGGSAIRHHDIQCVLFSRSRHDYREQRRWKFHRNVDDCFGAGRRPDYLLIHTIVSELQLPFKGVLTLNAASPVTVTGLRGRFNERDDCLMAATLPSNADANGNSYNPYRNTDDDPISSILPQRYRLALISGFAK